MKVAELRDLSETELRDRESQLAKQLFNLRLQKSIGQLEKPSKIRNTRRELAQVLTVLKEEHSG